MSVNAQVASLFREIAQILEIKGENVFRIRAYERAASQIESLSQDLTELARLDTLTSIPGIGKDLSERIKEYLSTGRINIFEELKQSIPEGVLALLRIPGVGPKTAKLLYERLSITGIDDLEQAIVRGRLRGIEGIKEKTIQNLVQGIALVRRGMERMTLGEAWEVAGEFVRALEKLPEVKRLSVAGSLRRQKETVRDIDVLVESAAPDKVMQVFTSLPAVEQVQSHGETKSSVRTGTGVQVDCRVVEKSSFGAALVYFTGSKDFNIKLRQLAIKKGLKVNEYGVFKGERSVAGVTEEEVFKALGMEYVEPELREDSGEVELALKGALPELISLEDIKGDLHVHSSWSDGQETIQTMALAAKKRGYSYVAITDHSQSLRIAGGLDLAALKKKKKEIEKVNAGLTGIRVLFGTEADIDSEGGIDYPDAVLKDFDIVVAALHTGFRQSAGQITKRLVAACRNPHVHVIAHPTGRLWGEREAYALDMEEVFKVAAESGTCLEINSYPKRLDLNDVHVRRAKEAGVRIVINTDSHVAGQLEHMRLGVAVARRGWLTKKDVLNTLPLDNLLKSLK